MQQNLFIQPAAPAVHGDEQQGTNDNAQVKAALQKLKDNFMDDSPVQSVDSAKMSDFQKNVKADDKIMEKIPDSVRLNADHYEIGEPLGGGGFGCVYQAIQKDIKRPVAVKKFHKTGADEQFATAVEEAVRSVKLSHPNIVYCSGIITTKVMGLEEIFQVMELGEKSLSSLLKECNYQLPFDKCTDYAQQIAAGINYLHSSQPRILHLDLKPCNALVFTQGRVVKLCDFGLSLDVEGSHNSVSSGAIGTYRWMAPEILLDKKQLRTQCDVYSFGAILYCFVCGKEPWSEFDPKSDAMKEKVKSGTLVDTIAPRKGCPQLLIDVCRRCLQKDPMQRPKDGAELEQLLGGTPIDPIPSPNRTTAATAHRQRFQQLQQTLRERYKNHPEWFERRGKKSIALSSVYVQLRIQRSKNANENSSDGKNNDQEDANHVGEIVTGDALPQRARAGSNLVLVHGPAGIGKTTLCKQLCVEQKLDDALAIFVPLKKLRECGEINNVGELLSQIANYELTKDDISFICANDVPILWLLDGFDEVQSAPGEGIKRLLHDFVDPITRKRNLTDPIFKQFIRPFDSVVVSSREERTPNDNCDLDRGDVDLWVVQPWPKKDIENFCTKWFTLNGKKASEIPAMVQDILLAFEDTSLMQHFAGLPLIVHMMCELRLDEFSEWEWTSETKFFADISPAQVFERMTKLEWRRSIDKLRDRFRDEATSEQKEQFKKGVDDSLYEFMMGGAARQGHKELIEHGGGITEFSLSLDPNTKKLPLWALLLAESGLLRFSDDLKHGSFPHRTFIEFLAARHAAKFPKETLYLQSDTEENSIPWENRYRMVWLLLADMALQNQSRSEQEEGAARSSADAVFDGLGVMELVQHVAKLYIDKYALIPEWNRIRDDAKSVAEFSEIVACNLLLQLCQVLPCEDVLNSIKGRHAEKKALIESAGKQSFKYEFEYDDALSRETTPPHFGWLLEHTGTYGAVNVLNWINNNYNDNYKILVTPQRLQSALARAYSAQERPAVSSFITVLDDCSEQSAQSGSI